MTLRRKVRDQADALSLLEELERSALKLSAFCASHGVDGRSLSCWKRNLEVRGPRPELRPIRLVEVTATATEPTPSAAYKLCIGGICIEVDDHFREDTLARLVRVAASC